MNITDTRTHGLPVIDIGTPQGIYDGTRAITTQSYVEANAKNGTQHELSAYFPSMTNNESITAIVTTTALPVVIKKRTASYTGDGVILQIFEGTTYSSLGGEIAQFNLSRINPVASGVTFNSDPVINDDGELAFASEYLIGNESNQSQGGTGIEGSKELILKPNTTYAFRVTSLSASQNVFIYNSWYEGELDVAVGM